MKERTNPWPRWRGRLFPPVTLPFERDATGRLLPAVVAVLVLLVVLLLSLAWGVSRSLTGWQAELEGRATVQILPLDTNKGTPLPQRVEKALAILRSSPAVSTAEPVADEDMAHLLAPWLGEGALPTDLPVPALIDVTWREGAAPGVRGEPGAATAALKAELKDVPGAVLDEHGAWLGDVRALARRVVGVASGLAALIVAASSLIIVLLVRAGLSVHRDAVELLHLMGAPDGLIAGQFQRHISLVTLKGAVPGSLLGVLMAGGLARMAARAGLGPPDAFVGWPTVLLAVGACFGFVLLSGLTAGVVGRRLLAELP